MSMYVRFGKKQQQKDVSKQLILSSLVNELIFYLK